MFIFNNYAVKNQFSLMYPALNFLFVINLCRITFFQGQCILLSATASIGQVVFLLSVSARFLGKYYENNNWGPILIPDFQIFSHCFLW